MSPPIPPTLAPSDAAGRPWDVVVAGAGVAGSLAARQIARAGARVLLVDRAEFPRDKVCGCCLNRAAVATLKAAGLGGMLAALRPVVLRRFSLRAGSSAAALALNDGLALSRTALDAALVAEAIRAGVHFIPGCTAALVRRRGRSCLVSLQRAGTTAEVRTPVAVAADGLAGRFLDADPRLRARVSRRSRFGAAADIKAPGFDEHLLDMSCGHGGYVGMVRLENGLLRVAAAFDPLFVRVHGGPGPAVEAVLKEARCPVPPGLGAARWKGTPALTRRRDCVQVENVFAIGDAAGYVEPFTGEGMAWGMASAVAAAPHILQAAAGDRCVHWPLVHRSLVRRRQVACRVLSEVLRRPRIVSAGVRMLSWSSRPARAVIEHLGRPQAVGGAC